MRTKNVSRDSTKSTTKQTRTSKHKKVSSSSYESSDDEKLSKYKNGSPEADKTDENFDKSKSPTRTNETTKHSVEKTRRSSSKKQTSKKEESTRSSLRKSRHRGKTDEDTRDNKNEDKDEKTNKGKSKSKHKSKNDKQPQIQDVQTKSDSEISENVQVTPQSPQANIDIPVDNNIECDENDTNAPTHEICDVPSTAVDEPNKNNSSSDLNDFNEYHEEQKTESDETTQNVEVEDSETKSVGEVDNPVGTTEWQSVEQEIVVEMVPVQGDSDVMDYQEDVLQSETNVLSNSNDNVEVEGQIDLEIQSRPSSPETGMSSQIIDEEIASSDKLMHTEDSNNAERIPPQSDEDSRSADAIILHESSNTPPRHSKFDLTESFDPEVRHIEDVNDEIQSLKDDLGKLFESPIKQERKHKWGNSLAGLELIKPSLRNITLDTIKEFCPNVAFLEETETRLATEHREKKVDRRISVDNKSDDGNHRYDTQSSYEDINIETDNSNIIALNRKISIVEDTASKLRPPPSPARNPVSSVLYISNLVRPFTLKQLKELLERTGRIKDNGFWTDHIKSKCYVHYGSSEEAEATRNALHGVNWPIGNGKQLVIEYTTPDDFEKARNPAPTPATPEKPPKVEKENLELNNQVSVKRPRHEEPERIPRERERNRSEGRSRNWDAPREERERPRRSPSRRHSRPREVRHNSRERNDRRHPRRTPTPPDYRSKRQKVKEEEPQKLMDDLFHKTKAVPSVYWLPLTPEEISTKQQERLLRMAEHKRRIEESTRIRGDHGRGAPPHRRRYD